MSKVPVIEHPSTITEDPVLPPLLIEEAFRLAAQARSTEDPLPLDHCASPRSCEAGGHAQIDQVVPTVPEGTYAAGRRLAGQIRATPAMADATIFYKHGLKPVTGGKTMEATLQRLGAIHTGYIGQSSFVKPLGIYYELDGKERKWDMVVTHPSVGVAIYHRELNALLIVRQFRPPVYVALQKEAEESGLTLPGPEAAFTYELCAGIVDKSSSLQQIAADEVLEECGFRVAAEDVKPLASYHAAIGFSGSRHHMFTVEVDHSMQIDGRGGGIQDTGESIEILSLPLENVDAFICDNSIAKSPGVMYAALHWKMKMKAAGC